MQVYRLSKRSKLKEGIMKFEGKEIKNKKLNEWLEGMSLQEKLKTLESGKFLMCKHCGFSILDKEKSEDHSKYKCTSSSNVHSFIESDPYIILERGFGGIIDLVSYHFGTPEEAVIRHFKRKR